MIQPIPISDLYEGKTNPLITEQKIITILVNWLIINDEDSQEITDQTKAKLLELWNDEYQVNKVMEKLNNQGVTYDKISTYIKSLNIQFK